MEDDVSGLGGGGLGGGGHEVDQLMLLRGKRDMMASPSSSSSCADNCSGNGICVNGSCHCQVGQLRQVACLESRNLMVDHMRHNAYSIYEDFVSAVFETSIFPSSLPKEPSYAFST